MQIASDTYHIKKKSKSHQLTDLKFEKCSCQKCLVESGTAKLLLLMINMSIGFVLTMFFLVFWIRFQSDVFPSEVSLSSLTLFKFVRHIVLNIKFPDAVFNETMAEMLNDINHLEFTLL